LSCVSTSNVTSSA